MNKREMIYEILKNADHEVLVDYSFDYLDGWDEETIKEEYEKVSR